MKFDLDGNVILDSIGENGSAVTTLSAEAPPRPPALKKPIRFVDTTLAQEFLKREILTTAQAAKLLDVTVEEFLILKSEHSLPVVAGYEAKMINEIAQRLNAERDTE